MKLVSTYPFDSGQVAEMNSKGIEVTLFKGEQELIDSDAYTDADIIIANHRTLQQDFLEKCDRVKWVQVAHIGIERLPMDYLKERGVIVINARGSMGLPIAEDIMTKMLMLARNSVKGVKNQLEHTWGRIGPFINLSGKTAGIIGAGDVGTETAIRARAFGMKVIGVNTTGNPLPEFDRMYKQEQLNEVIVQSDFIILTLPLTDASLNLLDEEQFRLMKPSAFIINISRGALINEEILFDYLKNNKIAGAGLDVFGEEFKLGKLPAESPFWELDNVIITPHCAGGGDQFHARFSQGFMHNLDLFLTGRTDEMINIRQFGKGY
ncbi:D-2-hydroxyacid dehydrogenase [Paenibacillus sp. FSL H8-0034]|uniref:D-2-hydroxyacid dehydrogenase n=1 Tax=Paenibacillus sp. FSL H8-0034 TaxID=2954671 RepID=UPI0030F65469